MFQNKQDAIHVLSRAVIVDDGKILLCKTLDLKINFYFLPGGHIEHGESAKQALLRELKEETNADCKIRRFLGCLEYNFVPGHNSICHNHEYNFIFEVSSEQLTSNKEIISSEKHIELTWLPISKLRTIDFRAEPLKQLLSKWLAGNLENQFISEMT